MKARKKQNEKSKDTCAHRIRRLLALGIWIQLLLLLPVFSKAQVTAATGSYIVDMGTATSNPAGVRPYGMVHELIKFYKVPVYWVVRNGKSKDAVDYTINGFNYTSGLFMIPGQFITPAVQTVISQWTAAANTSGPNGYIRGYVTARRIPTSYTFAGANIMRLTSAPSWTLDDKNGNIAEKWIKDKDHAGIPATQYNWLAPAALGACNDVFVMPHADPNWAEHGNLYNWNLTHRGAIWMGCHAGSALHNTYNPANIAEQMNFLTSKATTSGTGITLPTSGGTGYAQNSLILWDKHENGTPPYTTNTGSVTSGTVAAPDDWVSQFMGVPDGATTGGSENIYLPVKEAQWLSSTRIITYDPVPSNKDVPSKSSGPAVVMAYGRGFGDDHRGWVMLEAGHDIGGKDAANVAAERAFFNWSFLAALDKIPVISNLNTGVVPSGYIGAQAYQLSLNYRSPVGAALANVIWSAMYKDNGQPAGTFTPNGGTSNTSTVTRFVPFDVTGSREVVFSVTVSDNCGRFNIESWIGTIFSMFSNPDIHHTVVNNTISGSVATNDEAPAGIILKYSNPVPVNGADGQPNPSGAVPGVNEDGSYTFTAAVPGVYSYNITVCTNTGICQPQNLTITVTDAGSKLNPPIANTDIAATREGSPVDIPVLENDRAGNNDGILGTPGIVTNPQHGLAAIVNGQLRYTPAGGFSGRDTVVYQVCETPGGLCTQAYAIIDVEPAGGVNTTSAADDFNQTRMGIAVEGNVGANDGDAEGDAQTIKPQNITNGYGTFIVDANGHYTYTPAAGFTGTAQFTYTVTDNGGPRASAAATLYVYVKNAGITITSPDINYTAVNIPVFGSVATNDNAPAGTTLSYSNPVAVNGANGQPNPSGAIPSLNADGSYTFITAVSGVYSYNVKVCMNTGVCEQQNLTITVTDLARTDNAPAAHTDIAVTNTGVPVAVNVLENDHTGNKNSTLGAPAVVTPTTANGTATISGNQVVYTPNAGFVGKDTVIYQVCESPSGKCEKAYMIIDVKPVDINTTSAADDFATVREGSVTGISGNVSLNDTDAEGDPQSITWSIVPAAIGSTTSSSNGSYKFIPAPGFSGPVQIPYKACDTKDACANATLYIYVVPTGLNTLPDNNAGFVGLDINGNVAINDKVPGGTTYGTPVATTGPDGLANPGTATFTMNTDGSYTFNAHTPGVYSYDVPVCMPAPENATCKTELITITVLDPLAGTNSPVAMNDAASTSAGVPVTIPVKPNDKPGNTGGTLGAPSVKTSPQHGKVTVNTADGTVVYTPNVGYTGQDVFTYEVCESPGGKCSTAEVVVDVKPAGVIQGSAADDYTTTAPGVKVSGTVSSNDGPGQTVTVQPPVTDIKGTFALNSDGSFEFTAAASFTGTAAYPYQTCISGSCAMATLYITVHAGGVPDLTPSVSVGTPTFRISETTPTRYLFTVSEVAGFPTNNTAAPVYIRLFKSPNFDYVYDPAATKVGGAAVNNQDWELTSDNTTQLTFKLKPGKDIAALSYSRIGVLITVKSSVTQGSVIVNNTVLNGSGTEVRFDNNVTQRILNIIQ